MPGALVKETIPIQPITETNLNPPPVMPAPLSRIERVAIASLGILGGLIIGGGLAAAGYFYFKGINYKNIVYVVLMNSTPVDKISVVFLGIVGGPGLIAWGGGALALVGLPKLAFDKAFS